MTSNPCLRLILSLFLFLIPVFVSAQNLQQALEAELEKKGIPGLSLTVLQKQNQEMTVVGMADPDQNISLEAQHRMLSGSIGKTFFAALTMQLVEEGILDLDAKAQQYLTGDQWYRELPNAGQITIRNLMNHTSGIPEYVYARELWETIKADPGKQWTAAERMGFIAGQPPRFPVGEGWSYADANYIILGAIVEKVTGANIYDLVEERILRPCGLQYTQPSVQAKMENLTAAYSGQLFGQLFGGKIAEMGQYGLNPQFEWTGGGFVTNASDLARWAKCYYGNEVFSATSHGQLFAPVNRQTGASGGYTGYGLGTEIFATSYGIAYGHTGFMPGYLSLMAYLPDYDLSVALQVNTDPYAASVKERFSVFDLLEVVLPHYIKRHKAYKKKTTLYLVRHAEKADDGTRNPDLNEAGKKRAQHLAEVLKEEDIAAIYSTPFKRTMQTGQPLAEVLGQMVQTYPPTNMTHVYDFVANHPGEAALVIGHSNTVPAMVNWLLGKSEVAQLSEKEYGDIFTVRIKKGKASLVKSKF